MVENGSKGRSDRAEGRGARYVRELMPSGGADTPSSGVCTSPPVCYQAKAGGQCLSRSTGDGMAPPRECGCASLANLRPNVLPTQLSSK